jgi:hypothetical protein
MNIKTARNAVVIMAVVAMAALAAGCSGSPSSAGSGASPHAAASASSRSDVAFSACMRSRGVPSYPDPTVVGGVPTLPKGGAQRFGVSSSVFTAAQRACQHLLPATGGSLTASSLRQCYLAGACPQALVQHAMTAGRLFAECMRSHGVPTWPDPSIDSQGRPLFAINVPRAVPPLMSTATSECSRLEPAGSLLAWG